MEEEILFEPTYETFYERTVSNYYIIILIASLIFFNFMMTLIWILYDFKWFVYLLNIFPFVRIFNLIDSNKKYLKYLKINKKNKTIEYSIFKWNHLDKIEKVFISEIEIEVSEIVTKEKSFCKLNILYNGKYIIQQRGTNEWTKEIFVDIKQQINLIKN